MVEFEEGRRIAWRHFAGHIWRYILEPLGEQYDPGDRGVRPHRLAGPEGAAVLRAQPRNQRSIEATLDRLVEWARDR